MQYPNSVWWISQDLLTQMFIHRIFTYQYQSLKNIHFIVYPINCYIFADKKSCLTSKRMQFAEFSTIAKSLPQLRWNTHKSLILSYSEYLGRISILKTPPKMKVLAMAIEIGFIDYRSRFHISRDFYCPQWLETSVLFSFRKSCKMIWWKEWG